MSCFVNYSCQRCRCIFILFFHSQIFFWFNFRYVAKLFYLTIGKSSNSAQLVVQMLFCNRWNQESAGRVFFNISREKPTHTPDTPHVQPLSCKLGWTNQKHIYCFLLKPIRDNLAPGFPELLIFLHYMRKRALGRGFEPLIPFSLWCTSSIVTSADFFGAHGILFTIDRETW